jgi:hypothetical protein
MILLKDQALEVLNNSKVGLIGSSVMLSIIAAVEVVGEKQIRITMLYIGVIVGLLTIAKLSFEVYAAYIKARFRKRMSMDQDERRQDRLKNK